MGKRKAAEEEEVENEKPSWDRVEMERGGQPAEKRLRYYITYKEAITLTNLCKLYSQGIN